MSIAGEGVSAPVRVRVWGNDLVIEVDPDAPEEDFRMALRLYGLEGRDDYEVYYDADTGGEIYVMPKLAPEPKRSRLSRLLRGGSPFQVPSVATAAAGICGVGGTLDSLMRLFFG